MQYLCNLRTTDNGNRTELSPILSVIVLSDYKIGWLQSESNLLITSMITDQMGQQKVLLPINQNNNQIWETIRSLL